MCGTVRIDDVVQGEKKKKEKKCVKLLQKLGAVHKPPGKASMSGLPQWHWS